MILGFFFVIKIYVLRKNNTTARSYRLGKCIGGEICSIVLLLLKTKLTRGKNVGPTWISKLQYTSLAGVCVDKKIRTLFSICLIYITIFALNTCKARFSIKVQMEFTFSSTQTRALFQLMWYVMNVARWHDQIYTLPKIMVLVKIFTW